MSIGGYYQSCECPVSSVSLPIVTYAANGSSEPTLSNAAQRRSALQKLRNRIKQRRQNRPLSGTVATVRYQPRVHLRQSEVGLVAQKLRFLAATEDLPLETPQKALAETGFGTQSES